MAEEEAQDPARRDRSPSYPFISLKVAIERVIAFDSYFKRHPAPTNKVGLAWGMKEKSSQAFQTVAALRAFGLVEYAGSNNTRTATLSEDARTYLRAQQLAVKAAVLKRLALNPKAIEKYWGVWGADRPPDPVCLDQLVLEGGFTQGAAETFLKVYDETIGYACLSSNDKVAKHEEGKRPIVPADENVKVGDFVQWEPDGVLQFQQPKRVRALQEHAGSWWVFVEGTDTGLPVSEVRVHTQSSGSESPGVKPPVLPEVIIPQEREWIRGPLSSGTSYRLFVSGDLGPKEIGKLIKLLEAQKLVLSDDDEEGKE